MPMKVRDAIKLVEQDGWVLVRQKGSHRQYHHPTKPGTVTIAGKPSLDLDPKTERSIQRQAGLQVRRTTLRYAILIEPTATGYSAHVPDLPGCIAAGETREETLQLIREAIEFHLEGMRLHGESIPQPTSTCEYVEIPASLSVPT
jgi:predicted RNA binding protein YcfA (HicA-like mRNA interferase family)/predicted RNase H-like HicB family nuclease